MFNFGKDRAAIENHLARLMAELPGVRLAALFTSSGLIRGCWPTITDEDRLSAMSAATLSLGERIIKELKLGRLRYALQAGELGTHCVIALNDEVALVLDIHPTASLDSLFSTVQRSLPPICLEMGIQLSANWKLMI
jgi:uncharacterized protein